MSNFNKLGSEKDAFSGNGEINMNQIQMSLEKESINITENNDIDETPGIPELTRRVEMNKSEIHISEFNEASKFTPLKPQINDPSKHIFKKHPFVMIGSQVRSATQNSFYKQSDDPKFTSPAVGHANYLEISQNGKSTTPFNQKGIEQESVGDLSAVSQDVSVIKKSPAASALPSKKSSYIRDKATDIKHGVKKVYTSRRGVAFDDNDSNGEDNGYQISGNISYKDTLGNITVVQPNPRFSKYGQIFTNLLKQSNIITEHPIVSMLISYDSQRAIVVSCKDDQESYITQFSIQTTEMTFDEKIGGPDSYIKVKECCQNSTGQQFAMCYFDDGKFYMRVFGKEQRKRSQIQREQINFNSLFGLNDYTMAIDIFQDPYIVCCFVGMDKIFVSFFHNYSLTHYHFMWDIKNRKVIGIPKYDVNGNRNPDAPITKVMDTNMLNFPYKCFYSVERNEIFAIYRQGQVYTISPEDLTDYRYQRIIEKDLGQMELLFDQALCIRSSNKVLFFKQVYNDDNEVMEWVLYNSINVRGFIYFIRGNVRIQITTDQLIYFYLIDQETFEPTLENVMYNYMMCNQMMIGAMKRYSITYKQNERSFDVYQRKYMHNLRVCVDDANYEGAVSTEIPSSNLVLISKIDQVLMIDNQSFQKVGEIPITLMKTETREANEVIGISKSVDENWIAIISGKNLVMNQQKQNQLFIFKKTKAKTPHDYDQFILHKRIVVKDLPIFSQVCMQYYFKKAQQGADPCSIIFTKPECIFELNFENEVTTIVFTYDIPLLTQPAFFQMNSDQNICVTASEIDGIYINTKEKKQIDLDELYLISNIKQIIFDTEDQEFYFLCNNKEAVTGFFLIRFPQDDPTKKVFLTMWRHNLDIGDANMYISRGTNESGDYKELICGYKTIGINTYNTVVLDIATTDHERGRQTLQRHEAFQLWESPISGLLLEQSKDYLTFSRAGVNVLGLGTVDSKPLKDNFGMDKVLHSLDSLSYLKVDSINYINFRCQDYNNRVMSIEQEWTSKSEDGTVSTFYDEIYKIKIHEVTLRELLICQSFYVSRTTSDIIKLIKMQPDPRFFYKTFLELGGANFCSILSFDSMSMDSLLDEKNDKFFSEEYPIIYKNKMKKKDGKNYYYTNAIENALKNNQVKGVNLLMKYIVKYQNNFVSSFLFLKNLPVLMEKGISMHDLLASNVFCVVFDFDMWPGNHNDDEECIRAYNGSYFDIRFSYNSIFPEFVPLEQQEEEASKGDDEGEDKRKISKIKYSINLLAQVSMYMEDNESSVEIINEDITLMGLCGDTEELEIFETDALQQVIQFKWDKYGRNHHLLGCLMHMFYTLILIIYVKNSYLVENEDQVLYAILLAVGILYPCLYDMTQMVRGGLVAYFSDMANFADLLYIYGSVFNIFLQLRLGPFHIVSKVFMVMIVLLLISKTFFFLRIFPTLTPIVVMIQNVIYDLRIFMMFYLILIALFCQIFAILGLGNETVLEKTDFIDPEGSAAEYQAVGLHWGEFLWTFRLSLGDFSAVGATSHLSEIEMAIFWLMWMMTVIVTCIIFLNFVVAEACASYSRVVETLESVIKQAQAILISESEEMMIGRYKNKAKFPRYLVSRQIES